MDSKQESPSTPSSPTQQRAQLKNLRDQINTIIQAAAKKDAVIEKADKKDIGINGLQMEELIKLQKQLNEECEKVGKLVALLKENSERMKPYKKIFQFVGELLGNPLYVGGGTEKVSKAAIQIKYGHLMLCYLESQIDSIINEAVEGSSISDAQVEKIITLQVKVKTSCNLVEEQIRFIAAKPDAKLYKELMKTLTVLGENPVYIGGETREESEAVIQAHSGQLYKEKEAAEAKEREVEKSKPRSRSSSVLHMLTPTKSRSSRSSTSSEGSEKSPPHRQLELAVKDITLGENFTVTPDEQGENLILIFGKHSAAKAFRKYLKEKRLEENVTVLSQFMGVGVPMKYEIPTYMPVRFVTKGSFWVSPPAARPKSPDQSEKVPAEDSKVIAGFVASDNVDLPPSSSLSARGSESASTTPSNSPASSTRSSATWSLSASSSGRPSASAFSDTSDSGISLSASASSSGRSSETLTPPIRGSSARSLFTSPRTSSEAASVASTPTPSPLPPLPDRDPDSDPDADSAPALVPKVPGSGG